MIETATHSNFCPERLRGVGSSKRSGTHLQADSTTLRGGLRLCFCSIVFVAWVGRTKEFTSVHDDEEFLTVIHVLVFFCDVNFMIKNDCDWSFAWLESGAQRRHSGGEGWRITLRFGWIFDWHMQKSILDLFGIFHLWLSIAKFSGLEFWPFWIPKVLIELSEIQSLCQEQADKLAKKQLPGSLLLLGTETGKPPEFSRKQWQKEFPLHVSWWLHRLLISITS